MGNPMHSAHATPRCGAYARTTGSACRAPALRGKLRCRMHGGKAGRKPTHGRYTREEIERRREVSQLLRTVRQLIDDAA